MLQGELEGCVNCLSCSGTRGEVATADDVQLAVVLVLSNLRVGHARHPTQVATVLSTLAGLAHLAEHLICNQEVAGSTPALGSDATNARP